MEDKQTVLESKFPYMTLFSLTNFHNLCVIICVASVGCKICLAFGKILSCKNGKSGKEWELKKYTSRRTKQLTSTGGPEPVAMHHQLETLWKPDIG